MNAPIAIVGAGYVGLPLAVEFARAGRTVVCIEADARKVAGDRPRRELHRGRALAAARPSSSPAGRLRATDDIAAVADAEAVLICLPTPLSRNREPDLSIVTEAPRGTSPATCGRASSSCSSPPPIRARPARCCGRSSSAAASSPAATSTSRCRPSGSIPGRTDYTVRTTPKVVGGLTPACLERALELYGPCVEHLVPVTSCEAAELTKLLENIFRSVNIALVNELAMLCDRMELNVWEVVAAAATKPYGFMPFQPGPGLGGHCLPIDPFYLAWKARELDFPTEFIELAGKVNQHMPYYCAERIARALNGHRKAVAGSTVLVLGVAYKGDVGDLRESPALKLIGLLRERGADVAYHDPFVPSLAAERLDLTSAPLTDELLARRRRRVRGDGPLGHRLRPRRRAGAARDRLPKRRARGRRARS